MTPRYATERDAQALNRFASLMPQDDDRVLLVLKGHLLVEEQLRMLIDQRVSRPELVAKAELECYQVICLAEAFCSGNAPPFIWDVLRKLNKLRNDIAHKIELPGLGDRMLNIASLVEQNWPFKGNVPIEDHGPKERFEIAVWVLFIHVCALVEPSREPSATQPLGNRSAL